MMTLAERNTRIGALFAEAEQLLAKKGADYSPAGAAFENFDAIAALTGLPRETVLLVLFVKHLVTIRSGVSKTEPLRARIIDAINYLGILEAMHQENAELHAVGAR